MFVGADGQLTHISRTADIASIDYSSLCEDVRVWEDAEGNPKSRVIKEVLESHGMAGKRSEALAFAALLKRWNVADADGQAPCGPRVPGGLKCVQGRDDFEDLRRLNTPAMLQLMDRRGRQMHVALVQLQKEQAVLQLGDTVRRVPVAALESQWTHQYTVLWRPPPALNGSVASGTSGPAVDWIRERVAKLKGMDAASLPQRLDGALKTQLQSFQTLEGLRPSGAGDLRTLVVLASRTEPDAPFLDAPSCRR